MPQFSIIITSYNQRAFIRDAVASALAQAQHDVEVIVIDDCSSDGSKDALSEFRDSIAFEGFDRNQGPSAARNRGAALASGDYLVFLDGDDVLLPRSLIVYARIIELKRPKLILAKMLWFNGKVSPAAISNDLRAINLVDYRTFVEKDRSYRVSASAIVVERETFRSVDGWPAGMWPGEDHDLLMRLGYSGRTIQVLSPATIGYRTHEGNVVNQLPRVVGALYPLLRTERSGGYPGGPGGRFERRGVLGGVAAFYVRRALEEGFYVEALRLLAVSWPFISAAVLRRLDAVLRGRHLVETASLSGEWKEQK